MFRVKVVKNINSGSLELLKWVAVTFMTADHINKYIFNSTLPVLFEVGRVALPIFIFVMAYNFSRDGTLEKGVYFRAKKNLFIFGVISSLPYIFLSGYNIKIFPLNILFTLLVMTIVIENIDMKNYLIAFIVFAIGGAFVEYWWPSIIIGVSIWGYLKTKNSWLAVTTVLACLGLYFINGNFWAIASLPVIYYISCLSVNIPRLRWAFYVYYPLHLFIFLLIRIPLKNAGYLFF